MTQAHHSRVSLREITSPQAGRKEFVPDLSGARRAGIGTVQITPGGRHVPAAITIRTTVTEQGVLGDQTHDKWRPTISPMDSEPLLRRLLPGRENKTRMGALDVPTPEFAEAVSYDALKVLRRWHDALSALAPPRVGTAVEVTFAIKVDMTRVITFRPSSVDPIRVARGWAKHQNEKALARWEAGQIFMPWLGWRIWPLAQPPMPDLFPIPEIPEIDPWQPGGDQYEAIGDSIARHLIMRDVGGVMVEDGLLSSLWRAAFLDPFVAQQLTDQGYDLSRLEATRMPMGSLRELMEVYRGNNHMTMMAAPDLLSELGADAIRDLTRGHANTNFHLEIEED